MKRIVIVIVLAAAAVAAVGAVGGSAAAKAPRSRSVGVPLRSVGDGNARGLALFQLRGQLLRYTVVLANLPPNSRHAAHIHGPRGACTPASRNRGVVVPFPDLRADARGVAFAQGTINLRQAKIKNVLRTGFYFNVHEYSTPELQSKGLEAISCGNITS
ncbi:MAG: CHRD domain-containing protein [Actinomycetota bacterium]|nr:CHRD domain-containing protein [Actinomycetota bacterium]